MSRNRRTLASRPRTRPHRSDRNGGTDATATDAGGDRTAGADGPAPEGRIEAAGCSGPDPDPDSASRSASDGVTGSAVSTDGSEPLGEDPTDTAAYRWLRVVKLLVGLVVSLLTALELLGLLPA